MALLPRLPLLALTLVALFHAGGSSAAEGHPQIVKLDDLQYSQQQLAAKTPAFVGAYNKLIASADRALKQPLYSVMDKRLTAASGDKHDYYSFPPYWWPDPSKKDGLPYIRKDGETNPDTNSDATDKKRLVAMSNDVSNLALAWYFSQNPAYAQKAREQLVNWFINPQTRMNPNLQYAQAIPGINDGRGIGLIDSRALVEVIDAIELLRPANVISDKEYQQLKQWYGDFYHWMTTSQNGFEEDNWHNNHGTYFDLQAASFALFSGQIAEAKQRLQITQLRRIANQFDNQGRQMAELERTRPWHYSNFNLEAYNKLGRLGEITGVDVWNFSLDDHNLRKGYSYVAGFVNSDTPWQWKDIDKMDHKKALVNIVSAARAWPEEPVFREKAQWLMANYPDDITTLITPLKP
ncbi:alginate lyase family protein [Serratia fonticola]|uniref:alginate lyase family protein n=1 Tax=Serratia fonticola TaxID=47917 RepID=UPI0015C63246|nr:alginate lyase family protein [Serratia fonticola]MBC3378290.1 alginate lyase family protein [Serratia fonticola]NYA37490.1 alginate lyase family protein [Serratia fonticola]